MTLHFRPSGEVRTPSRPAPWKELPCLSGVRSMPSAGTEGGDTAGGRLPISFPGRQEMLSVLPALHTAWCSPALLSVLWLAFIILLLESHLNSWLSLLILSIFCLA